MSEPAWRIRALASGDEPAILGLFETVFPKPQSQAHWSWLFRGNPFSRPIVYLAETGQGQLVGHYALIPVPFRRAGKTGLGAVAIHSMIHPAFQRQGMLKALAAAAEKQLDEDHVTTGITFLNDNSLHVYTQRLGWSHLKAGSSIYFAMLDPRAPLKKVLRFDGLVFLVTPFVAGLNKLLCRGRRESRGGVTFRTVERFSPRVDDLWARFSESIPNTVQRDARYLNWRLAEKPEPYSLQEAEVDGELVGVLATKVESRFGLRLGYIVELLPDPRRPRVAEALLAEACRDLEQAGCSMVAALSLGPASLTGALRACGFRRLPRFAKPHGIHFCFKDRVGADSSLGHPDQWFLSWSDHDVV